MYNTIKDIQKNIIDVDINMIINRLDGDDLEARSISSFSMHWLISLYLDKGLDFTINVINELSIDLNALYVIATDEYDKSYKLDLTQYAYTFDYIDFVKFALVNGVNPCNNNGYTLLHWLCSKNELELLNLITNKETDYDQKDYWYDDILDRTPLHWAAQECLVDVMKFLVNKGANFNIRCELGKTALDIARSEKLLGVIDRKQCDIAIKYLEKINPRRYKYYRLKGKRKVLVIKDYSFFLYKRESYGYFTSG